MKKQLIAACSAILVPTLAGTNDLSISEPELLLADDPGPGDRFGTGVAADGGTAVIGALTSEYGTNSGSAYLFERDADGRWQQVAKLIAADAAQHDDFGYSVAIDGDNVAAAATGDDDYALGSGAAYVFERDARGFWHEVKKVTPSDPREGETFGIPAIDADTLVVTAFRQDTDVFEVGAAYVFERDSGGPDNWGEVRKLQPDDLDEFDNFGASVALEGDLLAIGAPNVENIGAVYLFGRDIGGPANWGVLKKLAPAGSANLGISVALDTDVLVAGSHANHTVFIFQRDCGGPDNWGLVKSISRGNQIFGDAVALSGNVLVVGDSGNSNNHGKARVYERNAGGRDHWGEVAVLTVDSDSHQLFGDSVAVDGASVLIGTPYYSDPLDTMGAVYAYTLDFDGDGDGVPDADDNCTEIPNTDQRDSNADGYGNLCDADLDNDGTVNFADLGLLKQVFFTADPDADLIGDGIVNFADLGAMKAAFFLPPGPSGIAR